MKKLIFLCLMAASSTMANVGDGYVVTNSQNIMHFVQLDEGKATDIGIYKRAISEICTSHQKCQVIFWADNAPVNFPFSREQRKSRTAYYQADEKKGQEKLYVDCKLLGELENAECL